MTIPEIQSAVAAHFAITVEKMIEPCREQPVVFYRQIAMVLCRDHGQHRLRLISEHFNQRSTHTITHARKAVQNRLDTDVAFCKEYDALLVKLGFKPPGKPPAASSQPLSAPPRV